MSLCESKRQQVAGILVGAFLAVSLPTLATIASLRVETQLNELIQQRKLYALMDAAGITHWRPLTEIQWVGRRFVVLFVMGVVMCGWMFAVATRRRAMARMELALLAILSLGIATINLYNMSVMGDNDCLQQTNLAGFATPPDTEPRPNQLMCSAWCHDNANVTMKSSCGALPPAVAMEYAAAMDITDWCVLKTEPKMVGGNATDTIYRAMSPFSHLGRYMECSPLDGWLRTLLELTFVTVMLGTIQVVFVGGFLLLKHTTRLKKSNDDGAKTEAVLEEKLVNI